jgi:hypothetical protein
MDSLDAQEIADRISPHLKDLGLSVLSIEVTGDELSSSIPVVDVVVSLEGTDRKTVHRKMLVAERAMSRAFGGDVRGGYYDASIGYEMPKGQAQLQFDNLPFSLAAAPAPKF